MSQYNPDPATNAVDAKKLWSGGLATAVVAALAAVVGLLVIRELLDVPVITPEMLFGRSQAANLAVFAAIAALVAAGLLHLLLVSTPRATSFFSWICTLATVAVACGPSCSTQPWPRRCAAPCSTSSSVQQSCRSCRVSHDRQRFPGLSADEPQRQITCNR